jgi:hypothetical protein
MADMTYASIQANARRHTADYVNSRGILIPATDYLARAVEAASSQGILRGQLLSLVSQPRAPCAIQQLIGVSGYLQAADAYMSLGTVSYTPGNEQYFRQAVLYLRSASQLQGYTLSVSMQRQGPV